MCGMNDWQAVDTQIFGHAILLIEFACKSAKGGVNTARTSRWMGCVVGVRVYGYVSSLRIWKGIQKYLFGNGFMSVWKKVGTCKLSK